MACPGCSEAAPVIFHSSPTAMAVGTGGVEALLESEFWQPARIAKPRLPAASCMKPRRSSGQGCEDAAVVRRRTDLDFEDDFMKLFFSTAPGHAG
jgi:hypothetical protein